MEAVKTPPTFGHGFEMLDEPVRPLSQDSNGRKVFIPVFLRSSQISALVWS